MSPLAHFAHPAHIALYLAPALLVFLGLKIAGRHVTDEDLEDETDEDR